MYQPGSIPTYLPKLSSTLIGFPVPEEVTRRLEAIQKGEEVPEIDTFHSVPDDEQVTVIRRMPVSPPRPVLPRREARTMQVRPELPNDSELRAAQGLLDAVDEMEGYRDALLAMPAWLPIGHAMHTLGARISQHRRSAAALIGCHPMDLES
jgi:hypothetical protein